MEHFLIKRDKEFSEMNAELDLKANILMKEAENLMKRQTNVSDYGVNADDAADEALDDVASDIIDDDANKDYSLLSSAGKSVKNKYGHSAAPTGRVTNPEPELRFLRAKLKILSTELERQQSEHHHKLSEWRTREVELRALTEERDKVTQQITATNQQLAKTSAALAERSQQLQRLEATNSKLTTELHAVKKESKSATQRANTLELRLNRLVEEGETLRAALQHSRQQEKEEREEQRKKLEQHAASAQRTERQRNELALAFRRQMLLCHNLQQQKELLVTGAALHAAETQFDQLLVSRNTK